MTVVSPGKIRQDDKACRKKEKENMFFTVSQSEVH